MSQRKNSVQLSNTVMSRLKGLVENGEFDSVDDAANFLLFQQLKEKYSPVLASTHLNNAQNIPSFPSTAHTLPKTSPSPQSTEQVMGDSKPKTALAMLKHAQQTTEVQ